MLHRSTTWVGTTAREIARAVRRGDTSATAVVADHLDSIRAYDRIVGAFREVRAAQAVAEAEIVDDQPELRNLPLAGVPVAVKENTPVAGMPTWNGSAAARRPGAERDHEVVKRLRGAGAVVVGVTKMPELGIWGLTDDADGITRNPWRTDRTPGGSSGGSAAAVAAGLVPIAHGNDGLGSIRIPAACCGIVGFKPGRGVVPADIGTNDWYGLTENGILASTVGDAAVGFAVLAGRTPEKLNEPGKLRVAVSPRSPVAGVFPDADARKGLGDAARMMIGLGHDAIHADPVYPAQMAPRVLATWFAAVHLDTADLDVRRLQPRTQRHALLGEQALRRGLVRAEDRDAWRERSRNWFLDQRIDVLVTPALATAPPRALRWSDRSWSANMLVNAKYAPYCAPWNFAGFPAIVVPVGVRGDGLPVAVQLVGPPGAELLLLALAGQIEQAAPWRRHAPGWPRVAARR